MGASGNKAKKRYEEEEDDDDYQSSEGITRKKIRSIKKINPNDDIDIRDEPEDRNEKKLKELNNNDDFNTNHPEYHEYMFFSMKKDDKNKKDDNLDLLLKNTKKNKKQKQLYTFEQEDDPRKKNELAQILHIDYDLSKPKYPYSIKKLKCDKPPVNNDYLVIEYNINRFVESNENSSENEEEEEEEDEKNHHKNKKVYDVQYGLTSRVVHTNSKNCKIANYIYTPKNGERYDYLNMNNDTNQVRKLKTKKNEDDEEKRVNENEENQDRFINKNKKKKFRCKKMF